MNTAITALDQQESNQMVVTWDIGRRCNFDCVYCDPLTHDNFSPHANLKTLSKTSDFIKDYLDIQIVFSNGIIISPIWHGIYF